MLLPLLSGCFKEDDMLPVPQKGNVITDTIDMTETYKYQVWYRLDSCVAVRSNAKTDSDIAFECSKDGWNVILNTADFARICDLGVVTFGAARDTAGAEWRFDKSDGNPDSIAIGRWFDVTGGDTVSNGKVYLLDRGLDELGNALGIVQITFDSLSQGRYYFRYTGLKGGVVNFCQVGKDSRYNYRYFSLNGSGTTVDTEPRRDEYDLVFTQYTTLLFTDLGEAYPYLVTGVLSNRKGVFVALDTITPFQNIDLELARNLHYSQAMDAIGYDWKYYDFEGGTYTIEPNRSYVIRDRNGFLYKLRFIGFYNRNGEKGYPVIESQRL